MNKPVAWVTQKALDDLRIPLISEITLRIAVKSKNTDPFNIPLYTHPVKEQELLDEIAQLKHINRNWQISENILLLELEKLQMRELTDEEIIKTMVQFDVYSNDDQCLIEAGRAILRKAQEK